MRKIGFLILVLSAASFAQIVNPTSASSSPCPTCAVGPGSSTTGDLAKFSGTDGLTLADQAVTGTGSVMLGTSPRLTTSILDANGNTWIVEGATASAVDGITVTNGATGNPANVSVAASGSDSNINLNITSLGTGTIGLNGNAKFNANGQLSQYFGTTTAAVGVPFIVGSTAQKAETASADANVLTFTPGASAGTYRACVEISVTSATSGVIGWTLSYTDASGNAQSNIAQSLFQTGTAAPALTFTTSAASDYYGCSNIIINNGAASIIVKWVGGGTTSAKMSATIERLQ